MRDWFNWIAQIAVDIWMALLPRRRPDSGAVRQCRIVAHRGAHDDNRSAPENTIEAFGRARTGGVWGIETDIRWTADLVPVISHDPDTQRVFGSPVTIREVTFDGLRARVPGVPSLAEVIARFGRDTHLMLELKAEAFPDIERQRQILREHLSGLRPGDDFHILALDPDLFETFDVRPRSCCLLPSRWTTSAVHRVARTLAAPYGGLTRPLPPVNDDIELRMAGGPKGRHRIHPVTQLLYRRNEPKS